MDDAEHHEDDGHHSAHNLKRTRVHGHAARQLPATGGEGSQCFSKARLEPFVLALESLEVARLSRNTKVETNQQKECMCQSASGEADAVSKMTSVCKMIIATLGSTQVDEQEVQRLSPRVDPAQQHEKKDFWTCTAGDSENGFQRGRDRRVPEQ